MFYPTVCITAALGAFASGVHAQAPQPRPLFTVGEKLSYEVRFGIAPLGTAEMQVVGIDTIQGEPAAHIQVRIRGGRYIFAIYSRMASWIAVRDPKSRR